MRVLIFGLPGAGKTTVANYLVELLGDRAELINADDIREECNDWDFSLEGRERQLQRMRVLAERANDFGRIAVCDFICPLEEHRDAFDADYEIFVDTIEESIYEDTNEMFERPISPPSYCVKEKRDDYDAREIVWDLVDKDFDVYAPTAQMLGLFRPWTEEHQTLFEELIEQEGQVAVMVRDQ